MSLHFETLRILSDGEFHSGAKLGAILGVSRAAVWKHLRTAEELGLDIHAVTGKGYRLARPLELLEHDLILGALHDESRPLLTGLEIHPHLDSTNTHLIAQAANGLPSGHACLAEYQSAGRGRRGRCWVSPYASNLYLSLLWRYTVPPAAAGGLSLVAGIALIRALRQWGLDELGLKWPNDVMWRGCKVAGTLLEVAGESHGPFSVVIGIGINIRMPAAAGKQIDQPWADIESALGRFVSRNALAGSVLHHLLLALRQFQITGLAPFLEEWRRWDIIAGKPIQLQLPHQTLRGVAEGVDHNGALLLHAQGITTSYTAGEVSVRL